MTKIGHFSYFASVVIDSETKKMIRLIQENRSVFQNDSEGFGSVIPQSFPFLLSGSYGLAEGNSTNVGTPVLAMGMIMSGSYGGGFWSDLTESPRNQGTYGFLSMRSIIRQGMSGQLRVTKNNLKTDELNDSKHGLSVCCAFEVLR